MRPRTIANLAKLIVFTIITVIVTGVLAFTIANGSFGGGVTYHAQIADVTSLLPGDDVRIAGVRVGQVQGIRIADDHRTALVTFSVQRSIVVRVSAHAAVRYRNLVGQRYIEISEGPGSDAPLPPGGTIPLAQTTGPLDLTVLFNGFRPLFQALNPADVNRLSFEIIQTLQGEGGTVDTLLATTASLTNTIADRDAVIGRVVDNLETVLATVDARDSGLSDLIVQMQRLVTGLAGDRQTIAASLGNINALAVNTAGLISGIRPFLPGDLAGLSALTNELATVRNPDGSNILAEFLQRAPSKINAIIRTATYGSWFNFYLCDFDYVTTDSSGHQTQSALRGHVNAPACNAPTAGVLP